MNICKKSSKIFGGSTITYPTWQKFSSRQQKNRNLADKTKVWILDDPQKQFEVQY